MDSTLRKKLGEIFLTPESGLQGPGEYLTAKERKLAALKETTPSYVDDQIDLFFSDFKTYFLDDEGRQEATTAEAFQKTIEGPSPLSQAMLDQVKSILLSSSNPEAHISSLKEVVRDDLDVGIDHFLQAYKTAYNNPAITRNEAVAKALEALNKGSKGVMLTGFYPSGSPSSASALANKPTEREDEALKICQDFFNQLPGKLALKGITLSGEMEQDKIYIEEEWENYKKEHEKNLGMSDAQKSINRIFDISQKFKDTHIFIVSIVFLLGIDLLGWVTSLPSDSWILTNRVVTFLLDNPAVDVNLRGLNRELGGKAVNLQDLWFGLLGQIYNNRVVKNWLETIQDPEVKNLAEDMLTLGVLVGMSSALILQDELIEDPWADHYQYNVEDANIFREMVQSMVRYIYPSPDQGLMTAQQNFIPSVDPEAHWASQAISYALRGVLLGYCFFGARNSARLYTQGDTYQWIQGEPEDDEYLDSFGMTAYGAIWEGYRVKGFASLMNYDLLTSDILARTIEDSLILAKRDDLARSPLIPLGVFVMTELFYITMVSMYIKDNPQTALSAGDNVGSVTKEEFYENFFDKYHPETNSEDLQKAYEGAAMETAWAFLLGGGEFLAASASTNREEVIQAFMQFNRMTIRNQLYTYTAGESNQALKTSDQGSGDSYYYTSKIMNTLSRTEAASSLWAGIAAGATASLSNKPWTPEYWPAYAGLILNSYYLAAAYSGKARADDSKEGWDTVIGWQWANFAAYTLPMVGAFSISRLWGRPFYFDVEFKAGRYLVNANLNPNGMGLVADISVNNNGGGHPQYLKEGLKKSLADASQELEKVLKERDATSPADPQREVLEDERKRLASTVSQLASELAFLDEEKKIVDTPYDRVDQLEQAQKEKEAELAELIGVMTKTPKDAAETPGLVARYEKIHGEMSALKKEILVAAKEAVNHEIGELNTAMDIQQIPFKENDEQLVSLLKMEVADALATKRAKLWEEGVTLAGPGQSKEKLKPVVEKVVAMNDALQRLKNNELSTDELTTIYREETGHDLKWEGAKPLIASYRASLEARYDDLSRQIEAMPPSAAG